MFRRSVSIGLERGLKRACNQRMTSPIRHFRAHAMAEDDNAPAAKIEAHSFEEAALTFIEGWGGPEEECRVTVRDSLTGEQHCFSLHHDGALSEGC